ncbi:MAG: hypothetical protein QGF09_01105 [Rhodospirillales bacterium]|nr:hypothetical protein [Rhodospirillales bacterium]
MDATEKDENIRNQVAQCKKAQLFDPARAGDRTYRYDVPDGLYTLDYRDRIAAAERNQKGYREVSRTRPPFEHHVYIGDAGGARYRRYKCRAQHHRCKSHRPLWRYVDDV